MSDLVASLLAWSATLPLPALLGMAALAHGLALLAERRGASWHSALSALGQALLLAAAVTLGLRALEVNVPAAWPPTRAEASLEMGAWLALVLYLVAGYWWRSPGLGLTLPLLLLAPLLAPEVMRDALVTRGLPLAVGVRPAFGLLGAAALALAGLGLAGLLARSLEARLLGQPRLGRPVVAVLLSGAAVLVTLQLALVIAGWPGRGRGTPAWTLPQSWLLAGWLALALASLAAWRGGRGLGTLTGLAAALLFLGLAVVAGATTRL